ELLGAYIENWPVSQWAAVGQVNLGSEGYFKAGVFDSNSALSPNNAQSCALANHAQRLAGRHHSSRSRLDSQIWRPSGDLPVRRLVEQRPSGGYRDQHQWRADAGAGIARDFPPWTIWIFHGPDAAADRGSGVYGPEKRLERVLARDLCGSPNLR